MRKIREVLRLKFERRLSDQLIASSVHLARSTVADYIRRANDAGLTWPLPPDLTDTELEVRLFKPHFQPPKPDSDQPDWVQIDKELRRKGVTRRLLWEEYRTQHPDGLQYATFTENYRKWKAVSGLTMRLTHKAGEKLFVDYAGLTLPITDPASGEVHPGQVFVATLGASDYTYAEVTRTQSSDDWLSSHVRALAFFGGVPEIIVPDNLKAGIHHPSFYEPDLNRAYAEFARHYSVAVIPARVRHPQDKAVVEVHVQIIERRVLAVLRDHTFFSLHEANEAVLPLVRTVNAAPFQKRPGSRLALFQELDAPALRALPTTPFEIAAWKLATVGVDYHVEVDRHYYSVPYQHAKTKVDVRVTPRVVEIYKGGVMIAAHARVFTTSARRHTTVREHMPAAHQQYGDWNPQRLTGWAQTIGPSVLIVIEEILARRRHPEQSYRSCLGVLRLGKTYGAERLEAACTRAVKLRAFSYRSVESILRHRLDELPAEGDEIAPRVPDHVNVRGPAYYAHAAVVDAEPSELTVSKQDETDPTLN